jgi:amidohydrolase
MAAGATSKTLPASRPAVRALVEEAIATRRDLHRHAELSLEEHRTQQVILERLRALGLDDVRPCYQTGATAIVRGARPGPTLLWRADIDGLPLREETGLPFASEDEGAMHACGHDGHIAIALGMAAALQQSRESLSGKVRFAFQPAEERIGGAAGMIKEGILEGIDQVYGLHIIAEVPLGEARVCAGPIMAAATHFRIIIRGQGGHASAPQASIDPIVVAAHVIIALQTIVSRSIDPAETAVLTVGRLEGGRRGNIIPNEVMMSGTVRTFENAVCDRVLTRMDEILAGVTSAWGATYQFDHSTLPAVVNDPECAAVVEATAAAFLGPDRVAVTRLTGADDVAYFLEERPGCFFLLGGGNVEKGITYPHHHPKFDFDENCLPLGIELGLRIVELATGSQLPH